MAAVYKTAMGKPVDMDMIRVANESVIAVGNMRTNARGDELGAGGKVIKTRAQVMSDYHKLNSPMAEHVVEADEWVEPNSAPVEQPRFQQAPPVAMVGSTPAEYVKPRGSFAGAVAEETEVKQELLDPSVLKKSTGVTRI